MRFPLSQIFSGIVAIAVISLTGCVREPVACFNKDKSVLEVGETVSFTNCSFLASNYNWNFGDGGLSTNKEPTHTFNAPGFFEISLTVSNKSGSKTAEVIDVVTVGYRMIQELRVVGLPATDSLGNPWDATDAPDVVLMLREGSGPGATWDVTTTENTDLADAVPFTWDISADKIPFTNATWYYELRDNDGGSYQVMSSGTFQPYQDSVDGVISQISGSLNMAFTWEIGY